jgi:hypothetical protein
LIARIFAAHSLVIVPPSYGAHRGAHERGARTHRSKPADRLPPADAPVERRLIGEVPRSDERTRDE